MIAIIDYGVGNLAAIKNMLKYLGEESVITGNPHEIDNCSKLILPGVGKFDYGMNEINKSGLRKILDHAALVDKKPILGICLGMQLMLEYSEEGSCEGLGWIKGTVNRFPEDMNICIPHMGWNNISVKNDNQITDGLSKVDRFYFVHSYYACPDNSSNIMFETDYGISFASGICDGNIFGVQFHPEKSHKYGMKLLKNFINM